MEARAALLARARHGRRFRLPGLGVRVALAGALALTILTVVAVAENLGGTGAEVVPVASAAVLERAAVAAETKPFTAPRDDQWIYIEDRVTTLEGKTHTFREWRRADGMAFASTRTGRLIVETLEPRRGNRPAPPGPIDSYKSLAALPTDPDALLRWAYERAENITGSGMNEHSEVYGLFKPCCAGTCCPPSWRQRSSAR